jgi:hypothetical protein
METSNRVLGKEHPDTLVSMLNVASTYRNQGQLNEVEDLEVQVVETSLRLLGQAHSVEIVMLEKLDCILSKRATRPYIYESTSANACVRIYV